VAAYRFAGVGKRLIFSKHQAGHAFVGIHARKVQRKVLAWSRFRGFRARF
jgi:hypothetical protein